MVKLAHFQYTDAKGNTASQRAIDVKRVCVQKDGAIQSIMYLDDGSTIPSQDTESTIHSAIDALWTAFITALTG